MSNDQHRDAYLALLEDFKQARIDEVANFPGQFKALMQKALKSYREYCGVIYDLNDLIKKSGGDDMQEYWDNLDRTLANEDIEQKLIEIIDDHKDR